jgi:hypothetical protein
MPRERPSTGRPGPEGAAHMAPAMLFPSTEDPNMALTSMLGGAAGTLELLTLCWCCGPRIVRPTSIELKQSEALSGVGWTSPTRLRHRLALCGATSIHLDHRKCRIFGHSSVALEPEPHPSQSTVPRHASRRPERRVSRPCCLPPGRSALYNVGRAPPSESHAPRQRCIVDVGSGRGRGYWPPSRQG